MDDVREKIRKLQALADNTTFPAERKVALDKIAQLKAANPTVDTTPKSKAKPRVDNYAYNDFGYASFREDLERELKRARAKVDAENERRYKEAQREYQRQADKERADKERYDQAPISITGWQWSKGVRPPSDYVPISYSHTLDEYRFVHKSKYNKAHENRPYIAPTWGPWAEAAKETPKEERKDMWISYEFYRDHKNLIPADYFPEWYDIPKNAWVFVPKERRGIKGAPINAFEATWFPDSIEPPDISITRNAYEDGKRAPDGYEYYEYDAAKEIATFRHKSRMPKKAPEPAKPYQSYTSYTGKYTDGPVFNVDMLDEMLRNFAKVNKP